MYVSHMNPWRKTAGRLDGSMESGSPPRSNLTFVDAVAEGTLEAAASINELHVGTHVGLAPIAPDGARLTVVH